MTAEDIRSTLSCPYKEFRRGSDAKTITDAFDSLGVFICYNVEKKCTAIEMAGPARPIYAGNDLLNNSFSNVFEILRSFDPAVIPNNDGLRSYALGIALYVPGCFKSRLPRIEGVMAFRRGYYENGDE
jgi:hypothetical protein